MLCDWCPHIIVPDVSKSFFERRGIRILYICVRKNGKRFMFVDLSKLVNFGDRKVSFKKNHEARKTYHEVDRSIEFHPVLRSSRHFGSRIHHSE